MKPDTNSKMNEGPTSQEWITGVLAAGKKLMLMVSAVVFIWMLLTGVKQTRDDVRRLENKIRKQGSGLARLAMLSVNESERFSDIQVGNTLLVLTPDATPPVDPVDADKTAPDPSEQTCKQDCKADSNLKADDKKKPAAQEPETADQTPAEKTTTTATRKTPATQPQKSKTIGQRHFGVGLKLSI